MFITVIPTLLRNGANAATLVRNGLFSVNHDVKNTGKAPFQATFRQ
jgi:hypothetical protein